MTYRISFLDDINVDNELWGGKAVSIFKLKNVGLNVPKGFVISTDVYQLYIHDNINYNVFENELMNFCEQCFNMNQSSLIFRSSANIEGREDMGCCGIYDSFIYNDNISLVENVQKVWNSVNNLAVKSYYEKMNYQDNEVKMAVIVQEIKKGQFSGVIQTYDIIQDKKCIILEYNTKELDSVVLGNEDAYIVYIDYSGEVYSLQEGPKINDKIIKKIINDCKIVESLFGTHVEMEVQINQEDIYYIQARSI